MSSSHDGCDDRGQLPMPGGRFSGASSTSECQVAGVSAKRIFRHRVTERTHRPATSAGVMRLSASYLQLYGGQSFSGATGYHLPFRLGDYGKNPNRQVIGVGHIRRQETSTTIPQRQQKSGIARQPVKLGDHQCRIGKLGPSEGLSKYGPIITPPRLDLRELRQQRHSATSCKLLNSVSLGL